MIKIKFTLSNRGIPYAYTFMNGDKKLVKLNKLKMRVSNDEELYIIYNGGYKEEDNIITLVPTDNRTID